MFLGIMLDTDLLNIGEYDIKLLTHKDINYLIFDEKISKNILVSRELAYYARTFEIGYYFEQSVLDNLVRHVKYIVEYIYDEETSCVSAYVFILLDIVNILYLSEMLNNFIKINIETADNLMKVSINPHIVKWNVSDNIIKVSWYDNWDKKTMTKQFEIKGNTICLK